jgi:signal transduction histidine kinase
LGPGIPEGDRPRLFDAFFPTKADGLGLGLSIIDSQGGEIDCEHLTTGTRFLFTVPVVDNQSVSDAAP